MDTLASFQAFWWDHALLPSLAKSGSILAVNDPFYVEKFKTYFISIKVYLDRDDGTDHSEEIAMIDWLHENMQSYLNCLAKGKHQTLVHGDLTNNNIMMGVPPG